MRWVGHTTPKGEKEMCPKFLSDKLKGRHHSEDLGVGGRIIFHCNLINGVGSCGLDSSASGQGPVVDSYEHDNELSSFLKGREFLDYLSNSWTLKKDIVLQGVPN
jgi:hypothetical protein